MTVPAHRRHDISGLGPVGTSPAWPSRVMGWDCLGQPFVYQCGVLDSVHRRSLTGRGGMGEVAGDIDRRSRLRMADD